MKKKNDLYIFYCKWVIKMTKKKMFIYSNVYAPTNNRKQFVTYLY